MTWEISLTVMLQDQVVIHAPGAAKFACGINVGSSKYGFVQVSNDRLLGDIPEVGPRDEIPFHPTGPVSFYTPWQWMTTRMHWSGGRRQVDL